MKSYRVQPGDTLSSIAAKHGIGSWQNLYYISANDLFRAKRPNPDLIFPGDVIQIPGDAPQQTAGSSKLPGYRMAIIDGTGEANDGQYAESMKNSFCTQLGQALGGAGKYFRGPSGTGKEVSPTANEVYQTLKSARNADPGVKLMLAGYSRGGSIAILAAELLEKDGIPVDSMFLFDAVARWWGDGGEVVPANVDFYFHARRDMDALLVLKYEGTVATDKHGFSNTSNPVRPFFSNTGLKWRGSGKNKSIKTYKGSHGAMGGVGWSFVTEDPACQRDVASDMSRLLQSRGLSVQLKSLPIKSPPAASPTVTERVVGWMLDAALLANHAFNVKGGGQVK